MKQDVDAHVEEIISFDGIIKVVMHVSVDYCYTFLPLTLECLHSPGTYIYVTSVFLETT